LHCLIAARRPRLTEETIPRSRRMELAGKRYARAVSAGGVFAALAVCACTLLPANLGGKGFVLFSAHPVLMSLAYTGCMGSAMLVYVAPLDEKKQNREKHRTLQMMAAALAAAGLLAIIINKRRMGKSIWPHTVHAWFGAITLLATLGQCLVGLSKYSEAVRRGFSHSKWHGDAGRIVYALGTVTIALGLVAIFKGLMLYALMCFTQVAGLFLVLVSSRCFPGLSADGNWRYTGVVAGSSGTGMSSSVTNA